MSKNFLATTIKLGTWAFTGFYLGIIGIHIQDLSFWVIMVCMSITNVASYLEGA